MLSRTTSMYIERGAPILHSIINPFNQFNNIEISIQSPPQSPFQSSIQAAYYPNHPTLHQRTLTLTLGLPTLTGLYAVGRHYPSHPISIPVLVLISCYRRSVYPHMRSSLCFPSQSNNSSALVLIFPLSSVFLSPQSIVSS